MFNPKPIEQTVRQHLSGQHHFSRKLHAIVAFEVWAGRSFVEVRRRIRTMCAFTTRSSCERILYSVFDRMNIYWDLHPLKPFTQKS